MIEVLDAFGADAEPLVLVGSCALALHARPEGAPLRATRDVDCISTLRPWVLQEQRLAALCSSRVLTPDPAVQCRYLLGKTGTTVDIMSPDGFNVGGVNPWFERAGEAARHHDVGGGRRMRVVTSEHFLATKLVAFADRGPDAQSSTDAEDVVTIAVEVEDLADRVVAAGMADDIAALWARVFDRYSLRPRDLPDFVDWHLDRRDAACRERVVAALRVLARA